MRDHDVGRCCGQPCQMAMRQQGRDGAIRAHARGRPRAGNLRWPVICMCRVGREVEAWRSELSI